MACITALSRRGVSGAAFAWVLALTVAGCSNPAPAAPAYFSPPAVPLVTPAPRLGQHTDEVLASLLGMPEGEIARLHDRKVVAAR